MFQIETVIQNTGYSPNTTDFDISLLLLTKPIKFNDKMKTVALPAEGEAIPEDKQAALAGWGAQTENGPSPAILQDVTITVFKKSTCKDIYGAKFTDRMLCAGNMNGGQGGCRVVTFFNIIISSKFIHKLPGRFRRTVGSQWQANWDCFLDYRVW